MRRDNWRSDWDRQYIASAYHLRGRGGNGRWDHGHSSRIAGRLTYRWQVYWKTPYETVDARNVASQVAAGKVMVNISNLH